jgi:hypothetical protein
VLGGCGGMMVVAASRGRRFVTGSLVMIP